MTACQCVVPRTPSAGEEWRRGWHPERIATKGSDDKVLIVGGGPSGLECALSLGRRGYEVTVAEAAPDFGGRLRHETKLPGLTQWGRVSDYRLGRLRQMPNVSLFAESRLEADDILEIGADRVVIATGGRWLPLKFAASEVPDKEFDHPAVFTPDDVFSGKEVAGPVVLLDFDNY